MADDGVVAADEVGTDFIELDCRDSTAHLRFSLGTEKTIGAAIMSGTGHFLASYLNDLLNRISTGNPLNTDRY